MTNDEAIKIIEDACWWYHKKGCSGLTQVEIFEARDRAIQALNSLEEVYANGYNDGFTQAEVNFENDKALSSQSDTSIEQALLLEVIDKCLPESGKWINDKDDMPTCSKCGYIPPYSAVIDDYEYSNYCPSCGCRMVEPQESEDKE